MVTTPKAWWNRNMEVPGREWYMRITMQVGDGKTPSGGASGKTVVPNPPAGFVSDSMTVTSLETWVLSS